VKLDCRDNAKNDEGDQNDKLRDLEGRVVLRGRDLFLRWNFLERLRDQNEDIEIENEQRSNYVGLAPSTGKFA